MCYCPPAAKDGSPRLRKTLSTKESKSKRKSAAGGVGGSGSGSGTESKPQSVSTSSPRSSNFPTSEDMAPEDVNVTRRGCVATWLRQGNG